MNLHRRHRFCLAALAACLATSALLASCANELADREQTIECQVFYRGTPGEQFQESIISLGPGNASHSEDFDDLAFSATFMDDPGEGPGLSLVASDPASGREIARQLYQIDRERGLADQFAGGHGFTGLIYVFHSVSSSELQYFCQGR